MDQPGSAGFASVIIRGHSAEEIQNVAGQVFLENGYVGYRRAAGEMLFEKEGTLANNLAYNGMVGTHYGQQTKVRVKTQLVPLGQGASRLQCQAFIVRNAGDSFFEDEIRLRKVRSGPYQELLQTVADRLK